MSFELAAAERTVRVSELGWYLLEMEADISGKSVDSVMQMLIEKHFISTGGGCSEINLTLSFDIDEIMEVPYGLRFQD